MNIDDELAERERVDVLVVRHDTQYLDTKTGECLRVDSDSVLIVPMPERPFEYGGLTFTMHNVVANAPHSTTSAVGSTKKPAPTGSQVQAFLEGLGVRLPAVEELERVRKDLVETAKHNRDLGDGLVEARASAKNWALYAEMLEEELQKRGARLSKRAREARPRGGTR